MLNGGFNAKQSLVDADQWDNYVAGLVRASCLIHN